MLFKIMATVKHTILFKYNFIRVAIPEKIGGGGGGHRGYTFFQPPGILHFFTLPLEIPDKPKLDLWIFHKIVLNPLEIPTYLLMTYISG